MRNRLNLCLLLALTACATERPQHHFRGPPPGHGGPGGGPGGFHGPPGGGRLFVSPMGEPFRGGDGEAAWFKGADADGNGELTQVEFEKDADRFFKLLDTNGDGEIDPDEIDHYETVLVPEIRGGGMGMMMGGGPGGGRRGGGHRGGGGGRHGGGGGGPPMGGDGSDGGGSGGARAPMAPDYSRMGAARFSYLALPEPVTAADTSLNRGVSAIEFHKAADSRFVLLDTNHDGALTLGELPAPGGRRREGGEPSR